MRLTKIHRQFCFLALVLLNYTTGFSQNIEMITMLNEKYNSIDIYSDRYWERDKIAREFTDDFIKYFEDEHTFFIDNSLYFPFVRLTQSDDGLIKIYSWLFFTLLTDNGEIGEKQYNSLIQFMTPDGRFGAKLFSDLIEDRNIEHLYLKDLLTPEYTEIISLGNNIYFFEGSRLVDTNSKNVSFLTMELNLYGIKEHNSFDNVKLIDNDRDLFVHNEVSYLNFFLHNENSLYAFQNMSVVGYEKNFVQKPYKIIFYISRINETIEFIYDALEKKFKGDYEYFNHGFIHITN